MVTVQLEVTRPAMAMGRRAPYRKPYTPYMTRAAAATQDRHGMLVIPGNCFGLEHHFRFSSALPDDYLRAGLSCLHAVVDDWR